MYPMISKWFELKNKALELRKSGLSIRNIESKLRIPRSTLSGWFRTIKLSHEQKRKLQNDFLKGLAKAREKAVLWHRTEKEKRMQKATLEASEVLNKIDVNDKQLLELALAILYLGEGTKANDETAIGNSDPLILKFFLAIAKNVYNLDPTKIRCQLNLRADQDPHALKEFWAKELGLSINNFKYVTLDQRTKRSKTYPTYKGVCQVRWGNAAVQRRLIFLSRMFCNKVVEMHLGS